MKLWGYRDEDLKRDITAGYTVPLWLLPHSLEVPRTTQIAFLPAVCFSLSVLGLSYRYHHLVDYSIFTVTLFFIFTLILFLFTTLTFF